MVDVGHVDKDGNFIITDRSKKLIKYKGFQGRHLIYDSHHGKPVLRVVAMSDFNQPAQLQQLLLVS